jgi:steroid 5-alpha reductase family enzyme
MESEHKLAKPWLSHSALPLLWLYVLALAAGTGTAMVGLETHVLPRMLIADLVATAVVFMGSWIYGNTSCYDPYWSVAPLPIAAWFFAEHAGGTSTELWVALLLLVWGGRLTWNFLRGWPGMHHEDWRYVAYRRWGPWAYWPISLFALHGFPTLIVFAALLPVWALSTTPAPIGLLTVLGASLSLASVVLCELADRQLMHFRERSPPPGSLLDTGVWSWVRHPNYLGEIGFWWGLGLMALGGSWLHLWALVGPLSITALFVLVSIPLKETRMADSRGELWTAYCARTPMLLPLNR